MGALHFTVVLELDAIALNDDFEIVPFAEFDVLDASRLDVEFQAAEVEIVVALFVGLVLELDVDIAFERAGSVDHHVASDFAVDN